jgi:hypothetical protein
MPQISFNINQNKFDSIQHAITAFHANRPGEHVTDENDFAKQMLLDNLKMWLDRYRIDRISIVSDQLATCSDAVWVQVTGLLGPSS